MPFLQRLATFLGLWLLAGFTLAIFAKGTVESGVSEVLRLVCLAPLISAAGIALALVPYGDTAWEQKEQIRVILFWVVIACFLAHSIITLTRRDRRQFKAWVTVQAAFLIAGVSCALSMYRYLDDGH